MSRLNTISIYIVFFLSVVGIVGCSLSGEATEIGNQALPEEQIIEEYEIEAIPLVEIPTSWELIGQISYNDEFGESNFMFEGEFWVGEDNQIDGFGIVFILHSGPCYTFTDHYEIEISGIYDPDSNAFYFYDLFAEDFPEDGDEDNLVFSEDNTFDTCTVGEGMGELFALLRPLFLLADADHGDLENGQVSVPAVHEGVYSLDFSGGVFYISVYESAEE